MEAEERWRAIGRNVSIEMAEEDGRPIFPSPPDEGQKILMTAQLCPCFLQILADSLCVRRIVYSRNSSCTISKRIPLPGSKGILGWKSATLKGITERT